jgi:hypothetical protein
MYGYSCKNMHTFCQTKYVTATDHSRISVNYQTDENSAFDENKNICQEMQQPWIPATTTETCTSNDRLTFETEEKRQYQDEGRHCPSWCCLASHGWNFGTRRTNVLLFDDKMVIVCSLWQRYNIGEGWREAKRWVYKERNHGENHTRSSRVTFASQSLPILQRVQLMSPN